MTLLYYSFSLSIFTSRLSATIFFNQLRMMTNRCLDMLFEKKFIITKQLIILTCVVADIGELELVPVARGVPDRGPVAGHAPRARQVLPDRPGRQRARRRHVVGQPPDAHGVRRDQQVAARAQGVHPRARHEG